MGTWNCNQMLRGRQRPDTATTTMGLDGQYMVTHDVAPVFDQYRTRPQVSDSYMTYNPATHMWVTLYVDNFGGYSLGTSPGWQGNTLTTNTTTTNDGTKITDVLTKVSDTQTTDDAVATTPDGRTVRSQITCTKSG